MTEETEGGWPHPADVTVHGDDVEQLDMCSYHFFRWLFELGPREVYMTVVP